jgi:hypothetical protein
MRPGLIDFLHVASADRSEAVRAASGAEGGFEQCAGQEALSPETAQEGIEGARRGHEAGDRGQALHDLVAIHALAAYEVEDAEFQDSALRLAEPLIVRHAVTLS